MRSLVAICAVIGVLALLTPPAHAQKSAKERAQELLVEGVELYQNGDRIGAVEKFEQAYEVFPSPKILYNLGRAYRDIGRNAQAHRALSRFLREEQSITAARRTEVEGWLAGLEGLVGLFVIRSSAAAVTITIDGVEVGTTPLGGPIAITGGVHVVVATRDGAELDRQQVAATVGASLEVNLNIAEPATRVPSPAETAQKVGMEPGPGLEAPPREKDERSKPIYKKLWFWGAVAGVAAASAAVIAVSSGGKTINDLDPTLGEFNFDEF